MEHGKRIAVGVFGHVDARRKAELRGASDEDEGCVAFRGCGPVRTAGTARLKLG